MLALIVLSMTAIILVTTLLACVSDVRTMRIPNMHSVVIAAAFVVAFAASPESFPGKWWFYPAALAIMFAITFGMFAKGMIGGGDAKLGSALALWVGLQGLVPYVFWMAIAGGLLGVVSLFIKKSKRFAGLSPENWIAQVQEGRNAVPYGIAISAGAWGALIQTHFLSNQLHEVSKIIH